MRGTYPLEISDEGGKLTRAAKLNDEIDKLHHALLSLKKERNEAALISVLPPEVLSKIFILVRDQSTGFQHQAPWLYVGQVCHRWREIALGCPSLWSAPVFAIPDLAREMVQRSRMATLTIEYFTSSVRSLKELENALSHIHRIQSINLSFVFDPQAVYAVGIFYSLSRSAPLLESFTIDVAFPANNFLFPLPTNILFNAPRLRSIRFYGNFGFSWESAIFKHRGLTDLCLSSHCVGIYGNSSFGQMVDALRDLPNLRTLKLEGSIPPYTTSNGNEKTIEFNFLERLELDSAFLFQHIRYPPHAVVLLYCRFTGSKEWRTLFYLINSNLRPAQSVNAGVSQSPVIIRSLRLTAPGSPEISFRKDLQYPTPPWINITLSHVDYPVNRSWVSLIPAISGGFDLSSIQDLCLEWMFIDLTDSERHTIRDLFMKFPKLKTLRVSHLNLAEIRFVIAETREDSSALGQEETQIPDLQWRTPRYSPPVTILPALGTLQIKRVNLHKHPWIMECLVDVLIKRSNMNAPIDRLSIERWVGRHTQKKRLLGELVIDLEIEGEVVVVKELDDDDDQDSDDDQDTEDEDMDSEAFDELDQGDYSDEYHSSNDSEASLSP